MVRKQTSGPETGPPKMNMQVIAHDSSRLDLGQVKQLAGGRPVRAPVVATFEPVEARRGFPPIELEVDVHDGRIVVTKVTLTATPESPLDSNIVRNYSLQVLAAMSMRTVVLDETEPGRIRYDRSTDAWEDVVTAVRQRPRAKGVRLERVAEIYKRDGIKTVASELGVSLSQAYRLKSKAIAAGVLAVDK